MFNNGAINIAFQRPFNIFFSLLIIAGHVQHPGMGIEVIGIVGIVFNQLCRHFLRQLQLFFAQRKVIAVIIQHMIIVRIGV